MNQTVFNGDSPHFSPGEHVDNGYERFEMAEQNALLRFQEAALSHALRAERYQQALNRFLERREVSRQSSPDLQPGRHPVAYGRLLLTSLRVRGADNKLRLADVELHEVQQRKATFLNHPTNY